MPIQIVWNNTNKTTLYQIFTTSFDLNDWYEAVSQTCIMLNTVHHSVNLILDLSKVEQLPIDWINVLNYGKPRYHANQAKQVAIVKPAHVKPMQVLLNLGSIANGIQIVSSIDDAQDLLKNRLAVAAAV